MSVKLKKFFPPINLCGEDFVLEDFLNEERTLKFLVGNGRNLGFRHMIGKRICERVFETSSQR